MGKNFIAFLFVLTVALSGTVAMATPTLIGLGDFLPGDNLVTFSSIAKNELITTQYTTLQGVTFSGALYGYTDSDNTGEFPSNGGGVIADNWLHGTGDILGLWFVAEFTTEIKRVGFYLETWPAETATVELFKGSTSLGSINYKTSSLTAEFLGIQELTGFNRMQFTNTRNDNGFYAIDDLRFGGSPQATPEPATMLLLGLGLVGLAGVRRRLTQ